jgi:hypothetical protein
MPGVPSTFPDRVVVVSKIPDARANNQQKRIAIAFLGIAQLGA